MLVLRLDKNAYGDDDDDVVANGCTNRCQLFARHAAGVGSPCFCIDYWTSEVRCTNGKPVLYVLYIFPSVLFPECAVDMRLWIRLIYTTKVCGHPGDTSAWGQTHWPTEFLVRPGVSFGVGNRNFCRPVGVLPRWLATAAAAAPARHL